MLVEAAQVDRAGRNVFVCETVVFIEEGGEIFCGFGRVNSFFCYHEGSYIDGYAANFAKE